MVYIILVLFIILAFFIWFISSLHRIFLRAIVVTEYEHYLRLKYNYPTTRLKILQSNLKIVITSLQKDIEYDITQANEMQNRGRSQSAANWLTKKKEDQQWLAEMNERLSIVTQELNRRAYYKATW